MKTQKNTISVISRSFVLFIAFLCLSYNSFCCDDNNPNIHDSKGNRCKYGCQYSVSLTNSDVFLGKFFTGASTNTLVAPNQLEFKLTADACKTYTFSFSMGLVYPLNSGNNYQAKISSWTWEKADKGSNGVYGTASSNRTSSYSNVSLYQPSGYTHCQAYAKFRMTAKTLVLSKAVKAGQIEFNITVTATVNNI